MEFNKVNHTVFFSVLIISLILCPVFVFIYLISTHPFTFFDGDLTVVFSWFNVLFSTLWQASLSAFLSVVLGIFGSLGLCFFVRYRRRLELLFLLPALLPALIPVLAWINIYEMFFSFPFSFYSVVGVHVLINVGLVSVFFSRLFFTQIGSLSAWAFLHSVSTRLFLKKILFFELKKDVILIFLLIFSFCFMSFSVPLLVGGVEGQTLEVFIAEKLKNPATWSEAMILFFIESVFIFIFFSLFYSLKQTNTFIKNTQKKLYLLPCPFFIILPILPVVLMFLGLGDFFISSKTWYLFISIKNTIFTAWVQTLWIGIGTGVCVFIGLCSVMFCLRDMFLRRFLISYCGSSAAFMGFAFLLIGSDTPIEVWLKCSVGLSLLFLPTLYRLKGEFLVKQLTTQIYLADLMGATRFNSFIKIIGPQCVSSMLFISGIAAFWACGDFAYSSVVAGNQEHLALLIQDLFSLYRFELATVLIWILIFSGTFCFSLFAGVGFVLHKKSYL